MQPITAMRRRNGQQTEHDKQCMSQFRVIIIIIIIIIIILIIIIIIIIIIIFFIIIIPLLIK